MKCLDTLISNACYPEFHANGMESHILSRNFTQGNSHVESQNEKINGHHNLQGRICKDATTMISE